MESHIVHHVVKNVVQLVSISSQAEADVVKTIYTIYLYEDTSRTDHVTKYPLVLDVKYFPLLKSRVNSYDVSLS